MFRRHGPSPPLTFFGISFNEYDKLRLINAPEEIIPAFRQLLGPLIKEESELGVDLIALEPLIRTFRGLQRTKTVLSRSRFVQVS